MNITPIAMATISHRVIWEEFNLEVEVSTWVVGKTQSECLEKWSRSHKGAYPSRIVENVVPIPF